MPPAHVLAALAQSLPSTAMPPGQPRRGATERIWVPHDCDWDKLNKFNNPNSFTWGSYDTTYRDQFWDKICYATYVQFLQDFGRDRAPDLDNSVNAAAGAGQKVQLSLESPYGRLHWETVAGMSLRFPPRTQPMHACRRAMVNAIQFVKEINSGVAPGAADRVAVVTFDADDAHHWPQVVQPLTHDYHRACRESALLQACSDIGRTTATENALILARQHVASPGDGGQGRPYAKKVIILLSDGVPNEWQTPEGEINAYIAANPDPDYYASNAPWVNAPLTQAAKMADEFSELHPIGIGQGTDYGFLDRLARIGHTADEDGQAVRGPVNPDDYERELTRLLRDVIRHPGTRLVQ